MGLHPVEDLGDRVGLGVDNRQGSRRPGRWTLGAGPGGRDSHPAAAGEGSLCTARRTSGCGGGGWSVSGYNGQTLRGLGSWWVERESGTLRITGVTASTFINRTLEAGAAGCDSARVAYLDWEGSDAHPLPYSYCTGTATLAALVAWTQRAPVSMDTVRRPVPLMTDRSLVYSPFPLHKIKGIKVKRARVE